MAENPTCWSTRPLNRKARLKPGQIERGRHIVGHYIVRWSFEHLSWKAYRIIAKAFGYDPDYDSDY